ncbi:MAG: TM0106 family RecB-like putative nuclease [Actinomycetes bacterium]
MRTLGDPPANRIVLSATDLITAAQCEFALARGLEIKLGRVHALKAPSDDLMLRAALLGDRHEQQVLKRYISDFGTESTNGVVTMNRPGSSESDLVNSTRETLAVLSGGVPVLAQGTVYDGGMLGHPDFLVRENEAYVVEDAKLARSAKTSALLQIAAYADMLKGQGVSIAANARLVLGSGAKSSHRLADLIPVYRARRAKTEVLVSQTLAQDVPIKWGDERFTACGSCWICEPEVEAKRDVLLVAGLRRGQRLALREAGIQTVEELANSVGRVEGIGPGTLEKLRQQAQLQSEQDERTASHELQANGWPIVTHRVISDSRLRALPQADRGDIFFDFEGDPLWTAGGTDWGLEYLFGVAEADGTFLPWWAHDRAEEKQALINFMQYVADRRTAHPGMHIYHYAPYETTALKRLVDRHGVLSDELDELLRSIVFVDLLAVVRDSVRISQRSYSLKKLEPLYMSARRDEKLDNAADSVAMYAAATDLRADGDEDGAQREFDLIAEYNKYDVESTLGLRNWLLGLVDRDPNNDIAQPQTTQESSQPSSASTARTDANNLAQTMFTSADAGEANGADAHDVTALRMLGAALGYHWREDKPVYWEYFARLASPLDDVRDDRAVFVCDEWDTSREAESLWRDPAGRERTRRRTLHVIGFLPEGSDMSIGWTGEAIYDVPFPSHVVDPANGQRASGGTVTVLDIQALSDGRDLLTIEERIPTHAESHDCLPTMLLNKSIVNSDTLLGALFEIARDVEHAGSINLRQPGLDVLRRSLPRTLSPLPDPADDVIVAITSAVRDLDHSYVAVQGPPGTGKTYAGARVIATLVRAGWKVGVVAQSHPVVENMLAETIKAGLDPTLIAKEAKAGSQTANMPWATSKTAITQLLNDSQGALIGGTAWTFTNDTKIPRGSLDLLVIDEAGQFSLANTLAVSSAAQRLLLLGDPQQLPQVSKGTHPFPVEQSALGWLMKDHATLPPELGYFLADTYRMHPTLTKAVSQLSYEDRLQCVPATAKRALSDVTPGLHSITVKHDGNSTVSREEILEVEHLARRVVGAEWTEKEGEPPTPLRAEQILVVAPYNAQVNAIRAHLDRVGLSGIRVGTVDKFQGQQAPVVIVSMTASSLDEVPRGLSFLLNRNRINVAISRAQWVTYLISSPHLTDFMPTTPDNFAELGAFLGLIADRGTNQ